MKREYIEDFNKKNHVKPDNQEIIKKIAVKIPEGVNEKVAASIMTKGLTSHYLLFKTCPTPPAAA